MASTFKFELVTPERMLVSEEVDEVIAPGFEGEFGVLPEHTYYLAILSIGILKYRKGNDVKKIAIGGGFAEVEPDKMVVMADVAEKAEEIDLERARRAHARAEATLKDITLDEDTYKKTHGALMRAIARMAAAG
jgi:F-type H+-transporting ATPase subunit epsilon